jgi:hypothetical protein
MTVFYTGVMFCFNDGCTSWKKAAWWLTKGYKGHHSWRLVMHAGQCILIKNLASPSSVNIIMVYILEIERSHDQL